MELSHNRALKTVGNGFAEKPYAISEEQLLTPEARIALAERQRCEAENRYVKSCERATRAEERVEELEQQLARVRELTIGPNAPPNVRFGGWTTATGLGDVEGPHPDADRPWVRWGQQPTRLVFETNCEDRMAVVLDVVSPVADQEVTVQLDGSPIARIPLPKAGCFEVVAIPFCVPRGVHMIEITYRHLHDAHGTKVGCLFRSLSVSPDYSRATDLLYQQHRGFAATQSAQSAPSAPSAPPAPSAPVTNWRARLIRPVRSLARRALNKAKRIVARLEQN